MKQLIIRPRRSGKTSWLKRELGTFLAANRNCYMVVNSTKDYFGERYITTTDYIKNEYDKDDVFFIDEYFFLPYREEFTNKLISRNHSFKAISTPDRLYDAEKIELIKLWRTTRELDKNSYITKIEEFVLDKFGDRYFYNLLSYPNVGIIPWERNQLSFEKYETEILGKIYKTD